MAPRPQRFWLPRSGSGSPVIGVGGPPESMRVDQIPVEPVFDAWCAVVGMASSRAPVTIGATIP